MIDEETIKQVVLARRPPGWTIQYAISMPVPPDLSYAPGAQAWAVCVMRKRNELTPELEEPDWLKGCDEETHQMYYADLYKQMGHAALTTYRIETVLVIASADERLLLFPAKPVPATPEMQGANIVFQIEFPDQLEEEVLP